MRKSYVAAIAMSLAFALSTTFAAPPAYAQEPSVEVGRAIYTADGKKLGAVYKVAKDGAPQVIISGKLITVPASSVALSGERIVTTLTRKDILTRR